MITSSLRRATPLCEYIRKNETTPPGGGQASRELEESIDLAPSRGGVGDNVVTPWKRNQIVSASKNY
jgi:hypothetical protein